MAEFDGRQPPRVPEGALLYFERHRPEQTTEKTDFSELSVSARIGNSVSVSDDLDFKSPYLRFGGAGRVDIGHGTIGYTARATAIGSPAGQDGADLAAWKGVTVPVVLSGRFDAIAWRVQWSGIPAKAIENRLKDKLEQRLGIKQVPAPKRSDKDKLRDELKRLLGR